MTNLGSNTKTAPPTLKTAMTIECFNIHIYIKKIKCITNLRQTLKRHKLHMQKNVCRNTSFKSRLQRI